MEQDLRLTLYQAEEQEQLQAVMVLPVVVVVCETLTLLIILAGQVAEVLPVLVVMALRNIQKLVLEAMAPTTAVVAAVVATTQAEVVTVRMVLQPLPTLFQQQQIMRSH